MLAKFAGGKNVVCSSLAESTVHSARQDFEERGYVFIRGLLPEEDVLRARGTCIDALKAQNDVLENAEAIVAQKDPITGLLDRQDVAKSIDFVLGSDKLVRVAETILDSECVIFPYKWLRAVDKALYTGLHVDQSYFSQIPAFDNCRVLSAWIPLGRVSPKNGAMVIAEKDTRDLNVKYAKLAAERGLGNDGTHSGWIDIEETDLAAMNWSTASGAFEAGDVVFFGPEKLHCTAANQLDAIRLSCDVRFVANDGRKRLKAMSEK